MNLRCIYPVLVSSLGLALLSLSVAGAPVPGEMPPRPTPILPPAAPPKPAPKGATLALHATFPEDWDFDAVHWQMPWTAVQWQDAHGDWHIVEGWQGQLDKVWTDAGAVVGQKVWWIAPRDLGTGPFRWVVYRKGGGAQLAASEPFTLPGLPGVWQVVEITLAIP